jgi:hypothetical protein
MAGESAMENSEEFNTNHHKKIMSANYFGVLFF